MEHPRLICLLCIALLAGPARAGDDVDGDGIPDTTDNCAEAFNPGQIDTNGDGFGNLCDTDLDNDGFTNFADLRMLEEAFFSTPAAPEWNADADFNSDESINFADLLIMKNTFFSAPGPIAITFINPAGGSWHDPANWSPSVVPSAIHTVRINVASPGTVGHSSGDSQVAGLRTSSQLAITGGRLSVVGVAQFNDTLIFSDGTLANAHITGGAGDIVIPSGQSPTMESVRLGHDLTVPNNTVLRIDRGLTLDATITLASSGDRTVLDFEAGGQVLDGTGEVLFGGTSPTSIGANTVWSSGGQSLTIGQDVTIRTLSTGGEIGQVSQQLDVHGTIRSAVQGHTVHVLGGPVNLTSSATVQAVDSGSFFMTLENDSVVDTPVIVGANGSLTILGAWRNSPGNTLAVTGGTMTLSGTWENGAGGTIDVNGGGIMQISGIWRNGADAALSCNGGLMVLDGTWTNESGATISQNGGLLFLLGDWINAGLVTIEDGQLDIGSNETHRWTNNGVITAVNSPVDLAGTFSLADVGTLNTDGDVLLTGQIDNTGMTLDLGNVLPGNNVILGSGAGVLGGTLTGPILEVAANSTFTLTDVTLAMDAFVENDADLVIHGRLTLDNTTVTLASTGSITRLRFEDDAHTLDGTGEVLFGGNTTSGRPNRVETSGDLTIGAGITIRSDTASGEIGRAGYAMTIAGTVISEHSIRIAGSPLTVTGATLQSANGGKFWIEANAGSLIDIPIAVSPGGQLVIDGDWHNAPGNVLSATGGGTILLRGNWHNDTGATVSAGGGGGIFLDGEWSNGPGAAIIQDGAILRLDGDWINDGMISVTDGLLDIGADENDQWLNNGTIDVVNSMTELDGSFSVADLGTFNTSGDVLILGQIDNTGMNLDLGSIAGNTMFGDGARVLGGTLFGAPFVVTPDSILELDDVSLWADVTLQDGAQLHLPGGLSLFATITLASTGRPTLIDFRSGVHVLDGTGEILFAGTMAAGFARNIVKTRSGELLTIGPDVTVRTATAGGKIGDFGDSIMIRGLTLSDLQGHVISIQGDLIQIQGTLAARPGARIHLLGDSVIFSTAMVNLEASGPSIDEYGRLTTSGGNTVLGGTLNLALVDGYTPGPCDEFDVVTWATRADSFADFNGPDLGGGETFAQIFLVDTLKLLRDGCSFNLSRLPFVEASSSSALSFGTWSRLIDGDSDSTWCPVPNDPAPYVNVIFPSEVTVRDIQIQTSLSPDYHYLTGRFEFFDAGDNEVYDSGVVALTDGEIAHDVIPDTSGVQRVRFSGVTWTGNRPCLSEVLVLGVSP